MKVITSLPNRVAYVARCVSGRGGQGPCSTFLMSVYPLVLDCSSELRRAGEQVSPPEGALEAEERKSRQREVGQPPPTLVSFQESAPLSVSSGNWNVTALWPQHCCCSGRLRQRLQLGYPCPKVTLSPSLAEVTRGDEEAGRCLCCHWQEDGCLET